MRRVSLLIVLTASIVGLVGGAPSHARGGTISYVFSTPIDSTPTDFSLPIAVREFNPALGELQSMKIVYTSDVTANMTVKNPGSGHASGTVYTEVTLFLTDPNNLISQENDITTTLHNFSLAAGTSKQYPSSSGVDRAEGTSGSTYTSSGVLSEFTGVGTINVTVTTTTYDRLTVNSGSATSTTSATADVSGYVTYTYTAVPEPSTLVLGALGTVSLIGFSIGRGRVPEPAF